MATSMPNRVARVLPSEETERRDFAMLLVLRIGDGAMGAVISCALAQPLEDISESQRVQVPGIDGSPSVLR